MSTLDISSQEPMETETPSHAKGKPFRKHQRSKPGNSKARRDDAYRLKIGQKVAADYHAKRNAKYALPPGFDISSLNLQVPIAFSNRPVIPIYKRIPFSTIGLGLCTSELAARFPDQFRNSNCSVQQLYRVTLAQFELQRQMSTYESTPFYPLNESLNVSFPSVWRDSCKSHPDNFKVLVYVIETFGRFKTATANYISVVPEGTESSPYFLTFFRLKAVVNRLASTESDDLEWRRVFFESNPLPGASVDTSTWTLNNANDFWPDDYDPSGLALDFVAVTRLLENMKAKFDQVVAKLGYSGCGKVSTLVSVTKPDVRVPYTKMIVPRSPEVVENVSPEFGDGENRKRRRIDGIVRYALPVYEIRPNIVTDTTWYSSEPLTELEASLGILSFSGVTFEQLEIAIPVFRIRTQTNSCIRIDDSWTALFNEAVPRVART